MIKSSMQQPQAARKRIKSMKVATAPRFALHWFQAEGDPRLELWPLAQLRQQSQWSWSESWSQSQCRTLVALLKAFSFHSLYFASFSSCEFMKMKIAKKLQNSSSWSYSHCVIFSLFCYSFFLFSLLCSLCCTLHSGLLSHGGVPPPTTYIELVTSSSKPQRLHSARSIYACLI